MRTYSDYTIKYVQDICDAVNESDLHNTRLLRQKYGLKKEYTKEEVAACKVHWNPNDFDMLWKFLQREVIMRHGTFNLLSAKGLINRGRCPYAGEAIDDTCPNWTYMNSRTIYFSERGNSMMLKEHEEWRRDFGFKPRDEPVINRNQASNTEANKSSEPSDLQSIIVWIIFTYLLASLFSLDFDFDKWNVVSEVIFCVSVGFLAFYIISDWISRLLK